MFAFTSNILPFLNVFITLWAPGKSVHRGSYNNYSLCLWGPMLVGPPDKCPLGPCVKTALVPVLNQDKLNNEIRCPLLFMILLLLQMFFISSFFFKHSLHERISGKLLVFLGLYVLAKGNILC